ncbi:unnamed protein product [Periconia digitata]|uniref:Zn(2)-C6 fungal-type domain-containing protein n=1 Tax=Periconia digitata TaxID=1303443 RepID=A0A9W4UIJ1_9PLEO|nr:unnamed protein product [Periconia digitata]
MDRDDWRHANACTRCYSHKLKCRRPPNQLTCIRCAKLQVQCIPRVPKRHRGSSSFPSPATITGNELNNTGLPQSLRPSSCETPTDFQPGPYSEEFAPDIPQMSDMFDDVDGNLDMQGWTDGFLMDFTQNTNSLAYDDKCSCTDLSTMTTVAEDTTSSNGKELPPHNLSNIATDLGQISTQLLALSASGGVSPSYNTNDADQISSAFEHSFMLATKLLEVMKQVTRSSRGPPESTTTISEPLPPRNSVQSRGKGSTLLDEQSDGLQLMSSYMRLLSIFNSHLDHLERQILQQSNLPQASVFPKTSVPRTPDQPVTQDFIVVNMIEFHLRRVGSVLRELNQRDDAVYQFETDKGSHGRAESAYGSGKGLDSVLAIIYEQQAILLRRVHQVRAELMAA